ncbi:MAG: PLD nuclease N-terminal domain-containing protein [Actinomycetes bacterium]
MIRVLLYVLPIALAIYALVDCIQTSDDSIRGLPKIAWIVLIVLIWVVGPIAWLIAGRDRGARRSWLPWPAGPGGGGGAGAPLAPDDDPEFLRGLGRSNRAYDQELDKWEEDLRRREDDGQQGGDDESGNRPGS